MTPPGLGLGDPAFVGRVGASAPAGTVEIFTVDFAGKAVADFVTGSEGLYFLFYTQTQTICAWFYAGSETEPAVGADGYAQVTLSTEVSAEEIAAAAEYYLPLEFTISSPSTIITYTDQATGARTDPNAGTSGLTITVTQQGS